MTLTVSDIAKRAGVSPDAVRFYEREGLLPPAPRSHSGYRQYDETTAERIQFIKGAQSFGLRLNEIRELLEITDKGACPCGHTKILLQQRMSELDEELDRLKSLRTDLERMSELDCPVDRMAEWPCVTEFVTRGDKA
jgi:DNA-binding transcriptional MerR regulator